jgi:phosphatidylglycerophosphate synthase
VNGEEVPARRPVAARRSGWAVAIAARLARGRVQPNEISLLSLVAAATAGVCLLLSGRTSLYWQVALLVLAAGLIELRLLCNLLDGMVAVEGGLATKRGPVFNELPDRISDALVLVCAGYVAGAPAWTPALGWCAALLAVLTAYVRALAGSLGATQDFGGPMAKQARMQVMAVACLAGTVLAPWNRTGWAVAVALAIVAVGSAATVARRTAHLLQELDSR